MTHSTTPIRWGIASTGKISNGMATALSTLDDAEIVAVGSRTQASADDFAGRFGIPKAHGTFDELCADTDVDIVYIGSPHNEHAAMTIAALDAGKHVLCEKAFALNVSQARVMIDAARRNERFLMEAMWSWLMPIWHDLRFRIARGVIGDVTLVQASFGISVLEEDGRHRRPDLAGGALLDLGIYPLAIGRFLLGEPTDVRALATLTDAGVDAILGGVMRHESGALTVFDTTIDALSDLTATIVGSEGSIVVGPPFWYPASYTITPAGGAPETVEFENRGLAHEAEHVMACLRDGRIESDVVTWDATLANMELMDEIRRQVGVVYPDEV